MEIELPYKVEYSKSNRASCKGCKSKIDKEVVRMAVMVQSAFHDGKQPNWFHMKCFFAKQRPQSVGDIENFENLRLEDQDQIKEQVDKVACALETVGAAGGKGGKKRSKIETDVLKDFGIEYAKSGRAACRGCEQKILKDQVRVRKTVFDTEVGMKYGGQPLWHHIECFAQIRSELSWFKSGEDLPGFKSLKKEDKEAVRNALPAIKAEDATPEAKKPKLEPKEEADEEAEKQLTETIKKQTTRYFMFRDNVKDLMGKADREELLQANNQEPYTRDSEKFLDQVADLLTFGAIQPCPDCKGRQMLFHKSGYLCNGDITEWTKCVKLIKEPERKPCKIPSVLKQAYSFLKQVAKKPETRCIRYIAPSASTIAKSAALKSDVKDEHVPKVKRERPPLYELTFVCVGIKDDKKIKEQVASLGGKCSTRLTESTIAIFSTQKEVDRMGSRMEKAKELGIHVIPVEYLDAVKDKPESAIAFITSMSLCDWGTDPSARVPQEDHKSGKSKSIYTKSMPKSQTLTLKGGHAVDPDSGLENVAHVYIKKKDVYNVVLGLTDIQRNKNSFYKIQLLESDTKNKFWIFRAWGRIGTTIGGNKLEKYDTLLEALDQFESLYRDRTGNEFADRENFVKKPGFMYPIDIDYQDDNKIDLSAEHKQKSKLATEVQDLIKLLFDIDSMKRTMLEFHLDMEKMPLGKLSRKQIQSAYKVLTEIYELINQQPAAGNGLFIDASNRFYTLIPHNFGVQNPPVLDTTEQVEGLRQMLDSLLEIECAYSMLQTEDADSDTNPLDKHYEQLKTTLEPLDKSGDEFAMLKKYVANTHAETHGMYELEVVDIFKVARQGEARRFKPFKKLHNRKLLWHGSRLTNFAGILSHGLKIAPPEAPVTGYMFGKGIYFADMVSKSANYCMTSRENSTGLMLLSEVALGDMHECTQASYITKLPDNKHSCYGRGRTMPDPSESVIRKDGVEVPLGKPVSDPKLKSSLLYNEFIVYDIAQVNIQYLFRMNFKYKI